MDSVHLASGGWLEGGAIIEQRGASTRWVLASGQRAWLKRLRAGRAWQQADRAYREVIPQWSTPSPRLIARWPQTRAMLLSELPGRSATLHARAAVFREAGRALRSLHDLPAPEDPMDLGHALVQRAEAWAAHRAAPVQARAMVALIHHHRSDLTIPRVWCHRDYQPQNWVVDEDAFGVLDFEHTRPDHRWVDWVRLEARGWTAAQRAAFVVGYGAEPDPDTLRCMLALYAVSTVAWAVEHQDPHLEAIGRAALAKVEL